MAKSVSQSTKTPSTIQTGVVNRSNKPVVAKSHPNRKIPVSKRN